MTIMRHKSQNTKPYGTTLVDMIRKEPRILSIMIKKSCEKRIYKKRNITFKILSPKLFRCILSNFFYLPI